MERRKAGRVLKGLQVVLGAAFLVSLIGGCASTFIVMKDGKGYFFGSKSEGLYKMLCESGDLKSILDDTQLSRGDKDSLYKYNCDLNERSKEKITEIYASLKPEQRRDLRLAFQKHGYDINLLEC